MDLSFGDGCGSDLADTDWPNAWPPPVSGTPHDRSGDAARAARAGWTSPVTERQVLRPPILDDPDEADEADGRGALLAIMHEAPTRITSANAGSISTTTRRPTLPPMASHRRWHRASVDDRSGPCRGAGGGRVRDAMGRGTVRSSIRPHDRERSLDVPCDDRSRRHDDGDTYSSPLGPHDPATRPRRLEDRST